MNKIKRTLALVLSGTVTGLLVYWLAIHVFMGISVFILMIVPPLILCVFSLWAVLDYIMLKCLRLKPVMGTVRIFIIYTFPLVTIMLLGLYQVLT